jgi:hypothetical protein
MLKPKQGHLFLYSTLHCVYLKGKRSSNPAIGRMLLPPQAQQSSSESAPQTKCSFFFLRISTYFAIRISTHRGFVIDFPEFFPYITQG